MYNSLLTRQLKRHIKENTVISAEWQSFINAVNRSYEHYERDHVLGKQSLEISTTELRQLIDELSDKEKRISAIVDAALDGIIVLNEVNEIEICNCAAAKYLGFIKKEELIGKSISEFKFMTSEMYDNRNTDYKPNLLIDIISQSFNLFEMVLLNKNEQFLPIELSISDLVLSNKKLKICILRDISKRKQNEAKIALRHEITHLLLEAISLQEVAPKILSALCFKLNWEIACFWLRDMELEILKPFIHYSRNLSLPNEFIELNTNLTLSFLEGYDKVNWETREYNIDDAQSNFKNRSINLPGLKTYLYFPIIFENKSFGLIELFTNQHLLEDKELTKILYDIGSEIGMFIKQQKAEEKEAYLQKQLKVAARQAGMMQAATSVLHNVGNTLNSVKTSVAIIRESFRDSEFNNLPKVAQLIKEHKDDLDSFIIHDQKGKCLPEYLIGLAEWWRSEFEKNKIELELLTKNIEHIKTTIKTQQSLSRENETNKETFSINTLLDDLIVMNAKQIERTGITIRNKYEKLPQITLDRNKLLQILENLIQNAIDSLKIKKDHQKILHLQTSIKDNKAIQIDIIDNGIGIEVNKLTKLFSFGFTTKHEGHGFGLHSCSILTKEIGGILKADSEGLNKGAKFTLILPLGAG